MTEPQPDLAESAEASEMTNTKSNNDSNVPSHREAMNQILKKLIFVQNIFPSSLNMAQCKPFNVQTLKRF